MLGRFLFTTRLFKKQHSDIRTMAFSAHKDEAHMKEHFEDEVAVDTKAAQIAQLIKTSRHFVIFTGAGVSTSAGIPDFRGPEGVWTLQAQGRQRTTRTTSTLKAIPTPTHMSIVQLLKAGLCSFVVSQNTDGLHRKSGVPPESLAELHGNSNLEICENCGKQYLRDFGCRSIGGGVHDHFTGRYCTKCGGKLNDSIINFGEPLPQKVLSKAFDEANKADVCLVLGSSLTVTPAANIPETVGKWGKLAICNLQITPLDSLATVRVFAKTDDLMRAVMKHLGMEIPEWRLHRRVLAGSNYTEEKEKTTIYLKGVDKDGTPASFIRSAKVDLLGNDYNMPQEPFQLSFKTPNLESNEIKANFHVEFMGHYMEPSVDIDCRLKLNTPSEQLKLLEYNPFKREWRILNEREEVLSKSIHELKKELAEMMVDYSTVLEKTDLINLYIKHKYGEIEPSKQ